MVDSDGNAVRPTRRCLDDVGLPFPPLEHSLHLVKHPIIARAQQVPLEVAADGAERIVSIDDLVWFKVKASTFRGAVHKLSEAQPQPPLIVESNAWWWIGAAGNRKADSGSDDFYAQLQAEC